MIAVRRLRNFKIERDNKSHSLNAALIASFNAQRLTPFYRGALSKAIHPSRIVCFVLTVGAITISTYVSQLYHPEVRFIENEGSSYSIDLYKQLNRIVESARRLESLQQRALEMEQHHGQVWLVIALATIPRPNYSAATVNAEEAKSYLEQTIESVVRQLPEDSDNLNPLHGRIHTMVMLMSSVDDPVAFDAVKERFGQRNDFEFVDNREASASMVDPAPGIIDGDANVPGWKIRKQSRDMALLLFGAAERAKYVLLLEDDFTMCPGALLAIQHALTKASRYHPNWLSINFSTGLNGIILPAADAKVFAHYLLEHQDRRPPDHLSIEWYAGESEQSRRHKGNRTHLTFRYQLMEHIGTQSTLGHPAGDVPTCYNELTFLFAAEAFDKKKCDHDDLWPCLAKVDSRHEYVWMPTKVVSN